MGALKVQDLPKEEQEKLMAEAAAVGIRGILTGWGVETLQNKIEEEKAKQNGQNPDNVGQSQEQEAGENEQNTPSDEQKPASDEQNAENEEQNAPDVNGVDNLDNAGQNEENEEPEQAEQEPANDGEKVFNGICHICRSEVYNGKCTGCGFEVIK